MSIATPQPVDIYSHYCTMIAQLSTGSHQDFFGMDKMRVEVEIRSIIQALDGAIGKHLCFRLNSGELVISGSFEDLQMLSYQMGFEDITYYGLVDQHVVNRLKRISNAIPR